jgi:uncharacterized protein
MSDPTQQTAARANVQLVLKMYEAFARRDAPAVFALLDEDAVIRQSTEVPWGGTYTGHAEIGQFFAKLSQSITSKVALQSVVDAGDHVVVLGRTQGTVNATGSAFDVPIAHVWHVREGRIRDAHFHIDNPTMRAAL